MRPLRMARFIQQELAMILLTHTRNPLLQEVVVTHVKMSPDLHLATVYYRVMGNTPVEIYQEALDGARKFLEHTLGPSLRLPFLPELIFVFDEKLEEALRLDRLFERIERESEDAE
ncbi:MAG TPA: 30S ribosome-binding factor RbfA [Thermoanaerobaculia bacterium]|nr:30S ribosome-binding factor RbfA [Thermoanaerobaculia bacterium]HUM29566.1 30S ribosome-binding factor RbfA [Thermoanaerobaculia bacterium]HXK67949.1 30S ribosome-binding factor RbfA [Thermoanaerobaculia bacterium]